MKSLGTGRLNDLRHKIFFKKMEFSESFGDGRCKDLEDTGVLKFPKSGLFCLFHGNIEIDRGFR